MMGCRRYNSKGPDYRAAGRKTSIIGQYYSIYLFSLVPDCRWLQEIMRGGMMKIEDILRFGAV
ncbi:Uncharacterised protein [uncultured archaeon]|nr:Uncharacterised protein [uncultured archaeon]